MTSTATSDPHHPERLDHPGDPFDLLPSPTALVRTAGSLVLRSPVHVDGSPRFRRLVRAALGPGIETVPTATGPVAGTVRQVLDPAYAPEEYTLEIGPDGVTVHAADDAGAGWAVQTLRQLLPTSALGPGGQRADCVELPFVVVRDRPLLAWRGLHLDVARHIQPVDFLFRLVDLLALHKLNVLQLHLTDDQGWRFPVPSLPRLTEVGGWRSGTWDASTGRVEQTPHGGWYRREDLEALVAYAQDRGVRIVPEIDVPGHVRALLAAYPDVGARPGADPEVATTFGVCDDVLDVDDEAVALVETIFTELLDVFPSEDIHIGGDECPTTQWLADPRFTELAQRRGVDGPEQLQGWFTRHLTRWLAAHGRRAVAWDEVIDAGADPDTIVMAWRSAEVGARAAQAGHDVVMAPCAVLYFDHYQDCGPGEPGAFGGLSTVADVASFDPFADVARPAHHHVRGIQGQLWTEYLPTARHVEYAAFPRTCALAENAWSGPSRWPDLRDRLDRHLLRLDAMGVNYRPLDGPLPWQRGGSGRRARRPDRA